MKKLSLFVCALLVSFTITAQDIYLNNTAYIIDTVARYPVGPGTEYMQLRFNLPYAPTNAIDVFLLRVDTRNEYVSIVEELGRNKVVGIERPSAMAERISTPKHIAFAGVNGDFFATTGDVGRPTGLTIENNEYAYIGLSNHHVGGVLSNGKPIVADKWKYSGKLYTAKNDTLTISHVNYNRQTNELVLYNQHQGATTATNMYGTELLVELCEGETWKTHGRQNIVVRAKEQNKGDMQIPAGQAVLSGHGTMQAALDTVNIGDTLTVRFSLKMDGVNSDLSQSIGGDNYVLIVDSGRIPQEGFWNELHPRTGYGMTESGDTAIFCVADGRSGRSIGCTTKVLGEIMKHYGAWRAVNWDGGGSSSMYIRNVAAQVNNGSDGSERAVGNAMFVVASLPEEDNTVSLLVPYYPDYDLPYCGIYTPRFLGYNKYGLLLSTDVEGVQLSCDPSVGEIRNNGTSFFASTRNGGILTATLLEAQTQINIHIVAGDMQLRLDTVVVDKYHPYEIEVVNVNGNDRQSVAPSSIEWTNLTPEICAVDADGVISAVSNGLGCVATDMEGLKDTLYVLVQTPAASPLLYDDFMETDAWALKSMSGYNERWAYLYCGEDCDQSVVAFDYKTTRKPYILLTRQEPLFGLPDSIQLDFATDAVIESINMSLTTADGETLNKTLVDIPKGHALVTQSLRDLMSTPDDRAHYPLSMNYLRFYLSTETTAGSHYLAPKGILLCYNHVDKEADVNQNKADAMTCYPNPVRDMLYIKGAERGAKVVIYDMTGRTVMTTETGGNEQVDLKNLSSGGYVVSACGRSIQIIKQ